MSAYKHLLLAADLSENSQAAIDKAVELAETFGARLTLVHCIEPIPAYGYPGFADLESPIIEQAKKEMAKLGKTLNVPESDQRIEFGSVKAQVLKVAEELSVDAIIIGSHGRHGLARLLGSSANAIVHGADCDVITVRCADA